MRLAVAQGAFGGQGECGCHADQARDWPLLLRQGCYLGLASAYLLLRRACVLRLALPGLEHLCRMHERFEHSVGAVHLHPVELLRPQTETRYAKARRPRLPIVVQLRLRPHWRYLPVEVYADR